MTPDVTQTASKEPSGWNLNTPDDTAIVFLEDYAGRIPLNVYEDLQADIAQLVTDEREWVSAARAEGRREAVEHRESLVECCAASTFHAHHAVALDAERLIWPLIGSYSGRIEIDNVQRFREHLRAVRFDEVAGLNASESPPEAQRR